MTTLQKINNVQELEFREIERFFVKLGFATVQGKSNTVKIKLKFSVITLHCQKRKVKHGVVRTIKNQLKAEGLL